jgi:predicted Zn-dependent peptidase
MSPEDRLKRIAAVTPAQIRAVAKEIFTRKQYAISIVGPFTDEKEVRSWF